MARGKRRDYSSIVPADLNTEQLRAVVKSMANVANKRIWSLEKTGLLTESMAIKIESIRRKKNRFTAREMRWNINKKMSRSLLEESFFRIRDFLANPESRAGVVAKNRAERKRDYEQAQKKGYRGTPVQYYTAKNRLWQKVKEGLLSSDIAYYSFNSEDVNWIEYILNEADEGKGHTISLLEEAVIKWESEK